MHRVSCSLALGIESQDAKRFSDFSSAQQKKWLFCTSEDDRIGTEVR